MPQAKKGGRVTPKKVTPAEMVPTSVEEWDSVQTPDEAGFMLELPSGKFVRVIRNLDLDLLLKAGKIPNPLAPIIRKMMREQDPQLPMGDFEKDPKLLRQLMDMLQGNAARMMIEPKVSVPRQRNYDDNGVKSTVEETEGAYEKYLEKWQPAKGTLSVFRINVNDLMYLFAVGQGAAADLARFRAESNPTLAPVPAVPAVGRPTKRTSRSK